MTVTIYHNPACGTSRTVLALLREAGEEPHIVEYLETPLSHEELVTLLNSMQISARELLRDKGTLYDELGLSDPKWPEEALIDFMAKYPPLMNRPVVVTPLGAKLCRPAELVKELLSK